jgi:hypothetical protein
MSASSSAATSTTSRRAKSGRGQTAAFVLLGLFISAIVVAYLTFNFGYVAGEEFSPENFTRRTFTYYQLPLVQIQISPIHRTDQTNQLEKHLTNEKLVTEIPTTDDKRRWDLVAAMTGVPPGQTVVAQGEARILCSYLDAEREGKNVWLEWSKGHAELAKILWPMVAKLARQELYVFIPELLVVARGASEAAALQQQVDDLLARKYLEFAKTQQQLGQHAGAVELFTEAIAHSPELAEAFSGRAASLSSLGQKDRASSDLAQAQKFSSRR